jgi:hypothetical protein
MGIDEEKIDEIITAHSDTVNGLKDERDKYKDAAEKLPSVQKELDELKDKDGKDAPYKEKYEKEHKAFEDYKMGVDAEKTKAAKTAAYKALLKDAGVSDKRFDAIIKVTDLSKIELDDEGKVKDAKAATDHIKEEWAEFIVKTEQRGAQTETPPGGNGGSCAKSRAAMVAAKHNQMLYGVTPKGDEA